MVGDGEGSGILMGWGREMVWSKEIGWEGLLGGYNNHRIRN